MHFEPPTRGNGLSLSQSAALRLTAGLLATAITLVALPLRAATTEPGRLFGTWDGERTRLEQEGITFTLFNTLDAYSNVSGGYERKTEVFDRQRVSIDFDLEKLTHWQGATFFMTGVAQGGPNYAKQGIGVYTNPSGIEGARTTRLGEIGLVQKFFDGLGTLKVGKLDGVGEFGLQELGSTFLNDELSYVPNITFASGMPFDPAGKLGIVLSLQSSGGFYVKGGLYASNDLDAYAHDYSGFRFDLRGPAVAGAEVGYRGSVGGLPGVYKVGVHYNYGDFHDLSTGAVVDGNHLVYLNASQTLLQLDANSPQRHLDAGVTLSFQPENRNTNRFEATAILRCVGPTSSRPYDEIGLGFISSHFSPGYTSSPGVTGGTETTVELTYKALITPWLVLQPDAQVVFNPRGDSSRSDVVILGARAVVTF